MSNNKPTRPKGTRDFAPAEVSKRQYMLDKIRQVFTKFGFQPLETPAMENLSVLTGKYGDEGDKLLYKILNSGDYLAHLKHDLGSYTSQTLTPEIAEKGLRYDLTVPFARYVVMNRHELTLPFRRYQIQPVWRADRPQKGRYREFVQCDADVIGTDSLLCEAEIIMMLNEIMTALGIEGYEIALNSRKLLAGLSQYLGHPDKEGPLCVAIDKLDKIGQAKVHDELRQQGFDEQALTRLTPVLDIQGSNHDKLQALGKLLTNEKAQTGLREVEEVMQITENMGGDLQHVTFDPALARGLSYYTGIIFEVRLLDGSMGSISGGGRYDNLTGVFGWPDVSGVGISLGIDRIYDVMQNRGLFPATSSQTTQVMLVNFGEENLAYVLPLLGQLRQAGIRTVLYPDNAKMKKQLSWANKNDIPLVLIAGSDEVNNRTVSLKNMKTGEQQIIPVDDVVTTIKQVS